MRPRPSYGDEVQEGRSLGRRLARRVPRHRSLVLERPAHARRESRAIASRSSPRIVRNGRWAISASSAPPAITVPIYPTLLGWQIEYILNDSGSVACIASTEEQLQKLVDIRSHCPHLHTIIVCDSVSNVPPGVMTFQQVVDEGRKAEQVEGRARFDEVRGSRKAGDLATIVYTSGTTGNPKGAMLTHGNITSNVVSVCQGPAGATRADVAMSILPLSHILERTADYAYYYKGAVIAYAESVVKVGENLQEVKPDVFAAVPRLFEKMRAKILDTVAAGSGTKQKIFALGAQGRRGEAAVSRRQQGNADGTEVPIRDRRQARLQEDSRAARRAREVRPLRRRAALAGARRVLHRRRTRDPRGLRAHRDLARHLA